MLLASSLVEAQQGAANCREVARFGPETESQVTPQFEITGTSFRVSGEAREIAVVCWSRICGSRSLDTGVRDPCKHAVIGSQIGLSGVAVRSFLRGQQTTDR